MDYREYKNEIKNFKGFLSNEADYPATAKYILDKCLDEFFELCCTFSHVTINANRIRTGTLEISCAPKEEDMHNAREKTIRFIDSNSEINTDELLKLIHRYQVHAVFHNEAQSHHGLLKDENNGVFGKWFNFAEFPDEVWQKLYNEIVSELNS